MVSKIGGIQLLVLKFSIIISSSVVKSTNNLLLTTTAICNYATQLSNTKSVVAKLVATFLDYYKHIKSHNMQLNWWCHALQATGIITYVHKQILAHNAAFMVYVVMWLWLLMGSPAEVENKGLSAWPPNTICIV